MTMTKTQIKKRVNALLAKLEPIRDELEELKNDVEDELTEAQKKRQEWLDDVADKLGYIIETIDATDPVVQALFRRLKR